MAITLPHNFTARLYQEDFFSAMHKGKKRAVLVWHRRAGKDTSAWNYLIMSAVEKRGIYYYIFPTFSQGRKVIWDGMTVGGYKFIDFIPPELIIRKNNQEMKIELYNGSLIQIVGSDKYDAIMGTNPTGCLFSEYSLQNPNAWSYIRPILDNNEEGWAIFVFTPRGSNHAKELYDMAITKEDWFCQRLTVEDTKAISKEVIEKARNEGMSEDMVQQEFYCSFTLGIAGSYYSKYLSDIRDEGQIGTVPWDKTQQVHTAWDLGYGDSTSIIFFQITSGKEIHIINFYENNGEGLPFYANILKDMPYNYGYHFAPHDILSHELGSGHSRVESARALGINFTVLKTLQWKLEEGIELVRGMFPRFWIDEKKCLHLVKALENYKKEWDERHEVYKNKPCHDKWSHACDAARYMCIGIRVFFESDKGPTDAQVEELMDRYNPRFN